MESDQSSDSFDTSADESFMTGEMDNTQENELSWDDNSLNLLEVSGDMEISQTDYIDEFEKMLNNIKREMGDIEAGDCGLVRLFPEGKHVVQSNPVVNESEMQCEVSQSQNTSQLYAICIDSLNDTHEAQKSLYELSRQDIYLPKSQIIVSEETRNIIVNSNPYRSIDQDFTSHRMNTILACVWDSAVITTIQQNSK